MRWVITGKIKDGNSVVKAKLVARGYEEECLIWVKKDFPTCCKESSKERASQTNEPLTIEEARQLRRVEVYFV